MEFIIQKSNSRCYADALGDVLQCFELEREIWMDGEQMQKPGQGHFELSQSQL